MAYIPFLNNAYFSAKVGIGTDSPDGILEVQTTNDNRYIRFKAPNGEERFQFYTGGTGNAAALNMYTSDGTTRNVQISAGGASYFNAGNVGIGTTSPSFGTGGGLQITNATQANLRFTDTSASTFITDLALSNDDFYIINRAASGQLKFRVNASTEAMTIASNGNVGIGITSPSQKLHVNAGTTNTVALFESTDATSRIVLKDNSGEGQVAAIGDNITFATSSSGSERMRITDTGNVGIGTTSPGAKLDVNGKIEGTSFAGPGEGLDNLLPVGYYATTPASTGVLIKTNIDTNYGFMFGELKLEQFNFTSTQTVSFSATVSNTGTVITKAAVADIAITIKLFVYGGEWWIWVPTATTYITVSAFIYTGAGYQGQYKGFNEVYSVLGASVPSTGVTGLVDIVADVYLTTATPGGNLPGGPYLPLSAGASYPLTDTLYLATASNLGKLQFGTASSDYYIRGGGNYGYININGPIVRFDTNASERMRITSTGNVGIGTTSPNNELEVLGGGSPRISLRTTSETVGEALELGFQVGTSANSSTNSVGIIKSVITQASPSALKGDMVFQTNSGDSVNTKMVIKDLGNVGIGTTSPNAKLEISSTGNTAVRISTDGDAGDTPMLQLYRSSGAYGQVHYEADGGNNAGLHLTDFRNDANSHIIFNTQGDNERMRIEADGKVGIGTTNPDEKLEVNGRVLANAFRTDVNTSDYSVISRSSAGNAPLYVQSADSNTNQPIAKFFYGSAAPNQGSIVLNVAKDSTYFSNTNVGIGTTSPNAKLDVKETTSDVAGEIIVGGLIASDNVPFGKISFANTATANTQTNDVLASIAGEKVGSSNRGELVFSTSDSAAPVEKMRISSGGNITMEGALNVAGVSTLANVGYLGDGLGSVQYTLQSANDGYGTIDFGDVADVNIGRLSYNHNDNSFSIRTNNATALTLDSSQNATFTGSVTAHEDLILTASSAQQNNITSNTTLDIGVAKSAHNAAGYTTLLYAGSPTAGTTNNIAGGHLYLAAGGGKGTGAGGDIIFRVAPVGSSGSTLNAYETALTISDDKSATFQDQAFSAATSSGDASSTLTTKGYVDGLITGATIYRGAWDPSGGGYGSPDLSGVTQTSGYYYICSAAGTAEPNGTGTEPDTWAVGDWVIYNDVSGTGQWQKIDNSSVLSGVGTGQTVALWEGAGSVTDSETLGNAPITVSGNDTTFAGSVGVGGNLTVSGSFITINPTGNAILNVNGTADSFIEKDTGNDLYIANNVGDKDIKFRIKDDTTNIIALTLDGSEGGNATFSGDVSLADNKYLNIGASNDLKIHHNSVSNDSFISETGLGDLYILSDTGVILKSGALGENYANFTKDGPIELYYDNSKKFETSSAGISVAGSVQIADDTDTAVVGKVGTMRYRTGTEYVEVTGTELITNGDFATDTGWTKGAGWTIANGIASLTAQGASSSLGSTVMTVTSGNIYKVVIDVISTSTGFRLYDTLGVVSYGLSVGKNTFYRTVTSSSYQVTPLGLSGASGSIESVSVMEVTAEDASYADMCMQTGASTYEWVNIVRNTY